MSFFKRSLIVGFCLFTLLSGAVFASIEEVTMEQSIMDKAQRVLDGIYGKGNFIVLANVVMTDPRYEVKYTRQSQATQSQEKKTGGEKFQILPGYPVIKNLAPDNFKQLPFDSVTSYSRSLVRQIQLTIIVNKNFPKGVVGQVQTFLEQFLGLNPKRDKVSFAYETFSMEAPQVSSKGTPEPVSSSNRGSGSGSGLSKWQLVIEGLGLVALLLFMALYALFQLQHQRLLIKTSKSKGSESGGNSNISVTPNFELPKATNAPAGDMRLSSTPPIKRYFDFVTEETIDKLLYILKKEKVGLENITILVPCLPPQLAVKVMAELDIKSQAIVSMTVIDTKLVNKVMIEKFEAQLKGAMESLVGGVSVFRGIFEYISGDLKKQMLQILMKNSPEGYKKVRAQLVVFDDIQLLEDEEIKLLISEINLDLLSAALVGADPEVYQKIDQNLNASGRDLVEQFQSLKSMSLSKKDIESAQDAILRIIERLETAGRIKLRDKF